MLHELMPFAACYLTMLLVHGSILTACKIFCNELMVWACDLGP